MRIFKRLLALYIIGSVIISILYNTTDYWGGPRYGLLAIGVDRMTMVRQEGADVWGVRKNGGGGLYDGSRFSVGDHALSIYIFNPFSNKSDDALRVDFKLKTKDVLTSI